MEKRTGSLIKIAPGKNSQDSPVQFVLYHIKNKHYKEARFINQKAAFIKKIRKQVAAYPGAHIFELNTCERAVIGVATDDPKLIAACDKIFAPFDSKQSKRPLSDLEKSLNNAFQLELALARRIYGRDDVMRTWVEIALGVDSTFVAERDISDQNAEIVAELPEGSIFKEMGSHVIVAEQKIRAALNFNNQENASYLGVRIAEELLITETSAVQRNPTFNPAIIDLLGKKNVLRAYRQQVQGGPDNQVQLCVVGGGVMGRAALEAARKGKKFSSVWLVSDHADSEKIKAQYGKFVNIISTKEFETQIVQGKKPFAVILARKFDPKLDGPKRYKRRGRFLNLSLNDLCAIAFDVKGGWPTRKPVVRRKWRYVHMTNRKLGILIALQVQDYARRVPEIKAAIKPTLLTGIVPVAAAAPADVPPQGMTLTA